MRHKNDTRTPKAEVDLALSVLCIVAPKGAELTKNEIAEICGCPVNLIYRTEKRALRKLLKIAKANNLNEYLEG